MKATSATTSNLDSYEAGMEIATVLASVRPEICIVFASIHYDYPEFFRGFATVLPPGSTRLVGGSADGVYSPDGVSDYGISALGINSGGTVSWHIGVGCQAGDAGQKTEAAVEAARGDRGTGTAPAGGRFRAGMVFAGFKNDGVAIARVANAAADGPVIGGLTGDDWRFERGYVFADGGVYEDGVAFLGLSGSFALDCHSASGWKPIGKTGIVRQAAGNRVSQIDNLSVSDFIEEEFGIPPAEAELGVIPLAAYTDDADATFFLRTPSTIHPEDGSITFFGSIPEGTKVQVCNATQEDVLEGVDCVAEAVKSPCLKPAAAVIVSCGGRKWLLQREIDQEVARLRASLGQDVPFVGFSSFGEIGPFKTGDGSWTKSYFHNVSFVVLVLGDAP